MKCRPIMIALVFWMSPAAFGQAVDFTKDSLPHGYIHIDSAYCNNYFRTEIARVELISINAKPTGDFIRRKKKGHLFKKKVELYTQSTIIQAHTIDTTRIGERQALLPTEKDELEKILFGKWIPFQVEMLCYEPRNGIIFYAANGAFLGFMEICYECSNVRYTKGFNMRVNLGRDELDKLKMFFREKGILYGTQPTSPQ